MIDLDLVYKASLKKLHSFHREGDDGLRKLVLLNNFVFKKFVSPEQEEHLEWSEEDIKKDEEIWLDSCLNDLDEDEDGYVYVSKPHADYQSNVTPFPINCYDDSRHYEDHYIQNNNAMEYEQQLPQEHLLSKDGKIVDDVIIPHDLLHLPFFDPSRESGPYHMDIEDPTSNNINDDSEDSSSQHDYDVNMTEVESYSENLTCEKGFHPYWKDNSIIAPSMPPLIKKSSPFRPYFELNTRSFGLPKIFHRYRLGQDYSPFHIAPPFIRKLLQPDMNQSLESSQYESPLRRSKDDLDILYSLAPRHLDKGVLMDMISMLEYYGCKTNQKESNSSEINDNIWFVDNDG